jgi:hypothetical protein
MMQTLIDAGVNVNERNDDGWTALTANTKQQDKKLAQFLLDAGCDPNLTSHNGWSELYEAATSGDVEYVKFLLDIGTDPSIRIRPGWAPLHWAAANGHVEVTRMLIDAGADLSVISDQNVTPLDLARSASQQVISNMLSRAGARTADEIRSSGEATASALHDYTLSPIADGSKLLLMFDEPAMTETMRYGQFVYQPEANGRVYFISHLLDTTSVDSLSVRLASAPGMPREYSTVVDGKWPSRISFTKDLFEIRKASTENLEYFIEAGPMTTALPTTTVAKSWTGDWNVHQVIDGEDHLVFKTVPDWALSSAKVAAGDCTRFVGRHGELLARMNWLSQVPVARIEAGLDLATQHLLVACWLATLWSETVSRVGQSNN